MHPSRSTPSASPRRSERVSKSERDLGEHVEAERMNQLRLLCVRFPGSSIVGLWPGLRFERVDERKSDRSSQRMLSMGFLCIHG